MGEFNYYVHRGYVLRLLGTLWVVAEKRFPHARMFPLAVMHRRGLREGGENCVKYFKRGWNKKEGRESKDFENGGKLSQRMDAIQRGEGTLLRTMSFQNFTSIYFNLFFKICDNNTQIATIFHINSHYTLMFPLILEISCAQKLAFICTLRVITKYIALKFPNFSLKFTYISSFMLPKSFRSSVRKVFSKILQEAKF